MHFIFLNPFPLTILNQVHQDNKFKPSFPYFHVSFTTDQNCFQKG